ncbi:MAG: adenylyl-sulfate kinase, partial [Limisphaerales bacterium]
YRDERDLVRKITPEGKFIEVFVNAPLEICEQRDTKGLYAKARANHIREFTGSSAPYELPVQPEVELHTDKLTVPESVAKIIEFLHLQDEALTFSI